MAHDFYTAGAFGSGYSHLCACGNIAEGKFFSFEYLIVGLYVLKFYFHYLERIP